MLNLNVTPSSPLLFALEPYQAMCDYVAGHLQYRDLSSKGDGHAVLVFPGLGVSGAATADLRMRLQQLGYNVYDWKHGVNMGPGIDFDGWMTLLGEHLREIYVKHGGPVSLIGWSLGGTYARELAKKHPVLVRQVITLGTPFGQATGNTQASGSGTPATASFVPDAALARSLTEAPLVRSSSIYSQNDGIVNWRQCVGKEVNEHRNIEVKGVSHYGLVHHPEVLNTVAGLLKESQSTEM